LYRYFVSQSSEFCRHNPLCCFSTSVYCCERIFRYRFRQETFGYTLVTTGSPVSLIHATGGDFRYKSIMGRRQNILRTLLVMVYVQKSITKFFGFCSENLIMRFCWMHQTISQSGGRIRIPCNCRNHPSTGLRRQEITNCRFRSCFLYSWKPSARIHDQELAAAN
jgi:hypothetical protein